MPISEFKLFFCLDPESREQRFQMTETLFSSLSSCQLNAEDHRSLFLRTSLFPPDDQLKERIEDVEFVLTQESLPFKYQAFDMMHLARLHLETGLSDFKNRMGLIFRINPILSGFLDSSTVSKIRELGERCVDYVIEGDEDLKEALELVLGRDIKLFTDAVIKQVKGNAIVQLLSSSKGVNYRAIAEALL